MGLPAVFIVDAVTVAILLISAFIGRRRGLIKTISGILALILAFTLAGAASDSAAPVVSEKYVIPYFENVIADNFSQTSASTPAQLSQVFTDIGVPEGVVSNALQDISVSLSQSAMKPIAQMTASVAYNLTRTVLFIVFFLIFLLLLSLLLKVINLASRIPGINFINKTLGLILGLFFGYLIITVLSSVLIKSGIYLTDDLLYETTVLKLITSFSPLNLFAK